jgi:hypothetical protein
MGNAEAAAGPDYSEDASADENQTGWFGRGGLVGCIERLPHSGVVYEAVRALI